MSNKLAGIFAAMIFTSFTITAQVQVSKEPFHKKVLENKYLRLLDVWIKPGDTSLFHIHSTPSLFLHFTHTSIGIQIKGKEWSQDKNEEGTAVYRSFLNDTLVHRVTNCDTLPFHVTDIEILSPYKPGTTLNPLPFTVLFENEKAFAYRLRRSSFNKQVIKGRGPMLAELVAGNEVLYHNTMNKKAIKIKTGKFFYIKPGSSFHFSTTGDERTNMVLFEIK